MDHGHVHPTLAIASNYGPLTYKSGPTLVRRARPLLDEITFRRLVLVLLLISELTFLP